MLFHRDGARMLVVLALVMSCFAWADVDTACGQITASAYNGPGDFAYDVHSMPDLDQKRDGLDFDGSMYCVPTACMNLCAFAANFGFPGLGPGPGLWEGVPGHDDMTTFIYFMSLPGFMDTDPDPDSDSGGTNRTGKINGMTNWISSYAQPLCFVTAYPNGDGYWPTVDRAAQHGANGAIVQLSYGRYAWSEINGQPYLSDRQGGHAVTLKLAFANNASELGERLIHYRDPGTDEGNLNSNSDFDSLWPISAANIAISTGLYGIPQEYAVTSLDNPPVSDSQNRYQILDSYLALYPGGGLSYSDVELNAEFILDSLGFAPGQSTSPFDVGQVQAQNIVASIPHPLLHSALVLVYIADNQGQEYTQLYQASHNGRHTHLMDLPADARSLALGFGHTVFVATDSRLMELDVMGGVAELKSNTTIRSNASARTDAIAYDARKDRVVLAQGSSIYFLSAKRRKSSRGFKILGLRPGPSPIRSLVIDNGALIAATESDGVAASSLNDLVQGTIDFTPLHLPGVSDPVSADMDSYGRLYVSDDREGLFEYTYDSGGNWVRATDPYFNSADFVGRRFVAFRNRTNVRPQDLNDRQWFNVNPDDLPALGPDIPDGQ